MYSYSNTAYKVTGEETRDEVRKKTERMPMTVVRDSRARLDAEEAARRDFALRLGNYADANTRVLCACGLTMSRRAFQEHQEQTHHEEKKRTKKDSELDTGVPMES